MPNHIHNQPLPAGPETRLSDLSAYFVEDREWLQSVQRQIRCNLANNHFTIAQLADAVAISERQLRRRLKKLLGLRPWEYVTQVRLQYARQLLLQRRYKTLTQVAHAVGYRDVDSLRDNYKRIFGESPTRYLQL